MSAQGEEGEFMFNFQNWTGVVELAIPPEPTINALLINSK
jgi:hypothetical protein